MPPNVLQCWDSIPKERKFRGVSIDIDADDSVDDLHYQQPEFDTNLLLPRKESLEQWTINDSNSRTLWKSIVENDIDLAIGDHNKEICVASSSELLVSLSSIIVLNDNVRERDWLDRFGGRLSNVSTDLLEGLRKYAPNVNNMSTVADFNDNLCYHMQHERGLGHLANLNSSNVEELETILQANEYLGSFLTTKSSLPQPPHVDYPWEILEQHSDDQSLKIGFFPLTQEGMFLQIWPTIDPLYEDPTREVEGEIIFIPYGFLLTVPASTIHGGGFRTTKLCNQNDRSESQSENGGGNLRFHLYIATNEASLPAHQTNKYTEPSNKSKELSRRYVDSKHMKVLLENFFV